jgi:hypothetical protein
MYTYKYLIKYQMDPENPTNPNSLTDLEIKCNDNVSIYIGRIELARKTNFFESLLLGNFKEATSNVISLSHNSTVLITLFKYVLYGFKGNDYRKKQLNNLIHEDINDFFYACDEYQFNSVIDEADEYFSSDEKIMICFNAEMINVIHRLKLKKMTDKIKELINDEEINLTDLEFELMDINTLSFFNDYRRDYLLAISLWLDKHETNDEELEKSGIFHTENIKYEYLSDGLILQFGQIIDKMKRCPNTTSKIIHAIFYAKYENVKKKKVTEEEDEDEDEEEEEEIAQPKIKTITNEKAPTNSNRPKSEYQMFIKEEIPRQRALHPGKPSKEYLILACEAWNAHKNKKYEKKKNEDEIKKNKYEDEEDEDKKIIKMKHKKK